MNYDYMYIILFEGQKLFENCFNFEKEKSVYAI